MKCFSRHVLLASALGLAAAAAPARADFYALEGRFQCLDRPGAICFDATPDAAVAPPPSPRDSRDSAAPESPHPAPTAAAAPPRAAPPAPVDPIVAVARRIERNAPAPGDLDMLRRSADSGEPRALELLAWCTLRGLGVRSDAVAAYLLYGRAAAAGVPHARQNQALVYERTLTSAERQRVLDMAAKSPRGADSLAASSLDGAPDER